MMQPLQENKKYGGRGIAKMYWEKILIRGGLERRRGEKCFYVFQSLRTERAAVSMSGTPPAVEATF